METEGFATLDMIHHLLLTWVLFHISDGSWPYNLNIRVKSGSPGIIPCQYEVKNKANRKYWCQGSVWSSCSVLAYANETRNKFSITDYPAQSVFTVEWQNLQPSDSGYYWCAAEISGTGTLDSGYYVYLTVQSDPAVSVMSSSVSAHEGDDVRVQCFYTSGYQNDFKHWCRYKDQKCFTKKKTDTSQNSSVQISDDGESSFTVLMTGLTLSDSGWYFCSVGDLQVHVHLIVTKPGPKALSSIAKTPSSASGTDLMNQEHFCLSKN